MEKTVAVVLEEQEMIICDDEGERCEDCPDVNPNPPRSSDCRFFEVRIDGPICTRADGFHAEISRLIGRHGLDGIFLSSLGTNPEDRQSLE